jgi:hypothetical protein
VELALDLFQRETRPRALPEPLDGVRGEADRRIDARQVPALRQVTLYAVECAHIRAASVSSSNASCRIHIPAT